MPAVTRATRPTEEAANEQAEAVSVASANNIVRVSVAGASGYSGAELIRLLAAHPRASLTALVAGKSSGQLLADVFPSFREIVDSELGETDWHAIAEASDVVFLALPHGHALEAAPVLLAGGCKVIDLGADFRLRSPELYQRHYGLEHSAPRELAEAVYGLPELHREQIAAASLVANPGCYPTATTLALLPLLEFLANADVAHETRVSGSGALIIVDAKSGVSGAGRSLGLGTHYSEVNENLRPYGALAHRHQPEMEQTLSARSAELGGNPVRVAFVPQLTPMTRGILSCCYVQFPHTIELPLQDALELHYERAYSDEPFVRFLAAPDLPQTKATYGSNFCDVAVRVDRERRLVVAFGVLDNLVKGAAGQAVQNLNLLCGFGETTGLQGAPLFP